MQLVGFLYHTSVILTSGIIFFTFNHLFPKFVMLYVFAENWDKVCEIWVVRTV